jgi:uncharacterized protein (TIGR03437 family)
MRGNDHVFQFTRAIVISALTAVAFAGMASAQNLTTFIGLASLSTGPLIQAKDGSLYGVTQDGIYKVSLDGVPTVLASFGVQPNRLLQANDGDFYGTSFSGGPVGLGTVFKMTPEGTVTVLYRFGTLNTDGNNPLAGLIQASDGNLYGVTRGGGINTGVNNKGTIFRATLGGAVTTLYAFGTSSTDGTSPSAALVQGKDGNLYGVTSGGGTGGGGTVFRISLAGAFTTLFNFKTTAGSSPNGALIQATDGNFYGETSGGGAHNAGSIFQMTPSGTVTTIYSFGSATGDGSTPNGGVIQASNGNLYGTTSEKGYTNDGSIFKYFLTATPPPAPTIAKNGIVPLYSSVGTIQPGEWISIFGSNLSTTPTTWTGDFPVSLGGTSVTINGKPAYLWYVSPNQINVQAPNDTATGSVAVTVSTAGGTATSTVTLAQIAPSFSLLDSTHVTGIILRTNGSGAFGGGTYDVIGPTGSSLGYQTVAAKAGDSIVLFAVGLGPTKTAVPAGAPFSGSAPTTSTVTLLINNQPVTPSYAGETSAGLYQINLTVPAGLGSGDVPLQAIVGGIQTPGGVVISLQ